MKSSVVVGEVALGQIYLIEAGSDCKCCALKFQSETQFKLIQQYLVMIHKHFYYQFTDHVCCCKMLANLHKGGGGDGFLYNSEKNNISFSENP